MAAGWRSAAVMVAMVSVVLMVCVREAGASYADMEFFSPPSPGVLRDQLAMAYEGETEFLDEIARRMLAAASRSIGYGALDQNRTPCSRAGNSYYNPNCNKRGNQGGAYRRGCTAQGRCARG